VLVLERSASDLRYVVGRLGHLLDYGPSTVLDRARLLQEQLPDSASAQVLEDLLGEVPSQPHRACALAFCQLAQVATDVQQAGPRDVGQLVQGLTARDAHQRATARLLVAAKAHAKNVEPEGLPLVARRRKLEPPHR